MRLGEFDREPKMATRELSIGSKSGVNRKILVGRE
jgi:hypothetical protein